MILAPGARSTLALKAGDPDREYTDYILNGLPASSASRSIAIVGAGISGCVAGSLLAGAGHKVTIFEASERIGGRILTVRKPFSNGLYGEAGAMRLPSFYSLTTEYINKYGLLTNTFFNHDAKGNEFIFVNGIKQRRWEYQKNNGRDLKYPLLQGEEGITAEALLADALKPIADYVGKETLEGFQHNRWVEVVRKFGEYSVREYLKAQTFYSEGAIEMIEVLEDLESRSDQALLQQIVEINDHGPTVRYTEISGGMDGLPNAFHKELTNLRVPICFNCRLTAIRRSGANVTLSFEQGSGPRADSPLGTFSTDAVIVTIPFPGFRYVTVDPPLSHNKRKAIRELHYDAATKILLQFRSRFWEREDGIYGGFSVTDLPIRFIYYPSHDFDGKNGGVVIASYTWGDEARGWDSLSREDQLCAALDQMARIHGEYIKAEFVTGFVQSWATDRFSHGEAAMFYGGQLEELQPYIPSAEGNVHFGGEHTSLKHAWIEGAVESGIRTALEVAGLVS
jgi:monoamine oxidase